VWEERFCGKCGPGDLGASRELGNERNVVLASTDYVSACAGEAAQEGRAASCNGDAQYSICL
jgi:hypothetical protein